MSIKIVCECGRPEQSWAHGAGKDQHTFTPVRLRKRGSCIFCGSEIDDGLACSGNGGKLHQMEVLR